MKSADESSVSNNIDSKIEHLRRYCAYQERSKSQLKIQAQKIGIPHSRFDEVVNILSDEGFFNEQRFALAFVRGKFRVNKWGKLKIKAEMYSKQISSGLVELALKEIDNQEYVQCLDDLLKKKLQSIKNEQQKSVFEKLYRYAISKGFENDLVLSSLKLLLSEIKENDL